MHDPRTAEQIREHYDIERELAGRLRAAPRAERRVLYRALYDELFRRVPHHPQVTQKASPAAAAASVAHQLQFLRRFVSRDDAYLELGPGDCALAVAMCGIARQVVAVDVSDEITRDLAAPANFRLALSDGCSVPVEPGSITLAYSNQLMEHLHPDDAREQLANVARALAPGGRYVCVTPNRWSGPHDVSRHFDDVATGFHLHEYTMGELEALLRAAGFRRVTAWVGAKSLFVPVPAAVLRAFEAMVAALPRGLRQRVGRGVPGRQILGLRVVAEK